MSKIFVWCPVHIIPHSDHWSVQQQHCVWQFIINHNEHFLVCLLNRSYLNRKLHCAWSLFANGFLLKNCNLNGKICKCCYIFNVIRFYCKFTAQRIEVHLTKGCIIFIKHLLRVVFAHQFVIPYNLCIQEPICVYLYAGFIVILLQLKLLSALEYFLLLWYCWHVGLVHCTPELLLYMCDYAKFLAVGMWGSHYWFKS